MTETLNKNNFNPFPIDEAAESEYNLRIRHPERTAIYERYSTLSAVTRAKQGAHTDIPYGKGHKQELDLFLPTGVVSPPLLIFIHGGYWRALDKDIFSFIADAYVQNGIAVAMPNYPLVPQTTIFEIIADMRTACFWLVEQADKWGYDPYNMVVSGHSAGAHLAAHMVSRKNMRGFKGRFTGYVGLSPIFDLLPLLNTTVNRDLCLSADEARALGFYEGEDFFDLPFVLAVGELETRGFRGQSKYFFSMLKDEGREVQSFTIPNRTHFDMLEDFAPVPIEKQKSLLFHRVLTMFDQ